MTRTIEVLPKATGDIHNPQGWVIKATGIQTNDRVYSKKSEAVTDARRLAKSRASAQRNSVGLKIFGRDGEYQRQHVYEP